MATGWRYSPTVPAVQAVRHSHGQGGGAAGVSGSRVRAAELLEGSQIKSVLSRSRHPQLAAASDDAAAGGGRHAMPIQRRGHRARQGAAGRGSPTAPSGSPARPPPGRAGGVRRCAVPGSRTALSVPGMTPGSGRHGGEVRRRRQGRQRNQGQQPQRSAPASTGCMMKVCSCRLCDSCRPGTRKRCRRAVRSSRLFVRTICAL